jgi:hypothetical protein
MTSQNDAHTPTTETLSPKAETPAPHALLRSREGKLEAEAKSKAKRKIGRHEKGKKKNTNPSPTQELLFGFFE